MPEKTIPKQQNALGIAGFVLGILSIVVLLILGPLSLVFSITGLVLCIMQRRIVKTKLALAGLIINIAAIILGILWIIFIIWLLHYLSLHPELLTNSTFTG